MATTEIQLTNEDIHAAVVQYVKNKYDVKVLSTTIRTGVHANGRRTELRGAIVEVEMKEK